MMDDALETPNEIGTAEFVRIGGDPIQWTVDGDGYWNLRFRIKRGHKYEGFSVHAFIGLRPAYCDRGHYQFNCDGPFGFDGSDSFPRYYMDLQRAKDEVVAFLNWRIYKIRT